jgi:glycosyltransferase involved in cell wall biosynthesis
VKLLDEIISGRYRYFLEMRIVMIGGYPLTEKRSGSITHVEKLSQAISEMDGMEVHVITRGTKSKQFKIGNVYMHVVNRVIFLTLFQFPFPSWFIERTIRNIRPEVVHVLGGFPYSTIAMFLRKKYPSLLTVFSFGRRELKYERSILRILIQMIISIPTERYVIPKIRHIIVQTYNIKNIVGELSDSKIYIIPEGIEYEKIQRFNLQAQLIEQPDIFIAVNFRKLKGIDILIKAIPEVIKSVPELKVYIAGSGEEEEELKNLVNDLRLEKHVKFMGFIVDEREKYKYYKACKIVVVPSRWDNDPFAALDGAALGKPLIVSDTCSSSIVEDGKTGFIFESEDVKELSSKIVRLLTEDDLREQMGKAAREKVKEYDWIKIADRTAKVYKKVITDFHERKESGKNRRKRKTFIKS